MATMFPVAALPPPSPVPLQVGAVVAPAAVLAGGADAAPLPFSTPLPVDTAAAGQAGAESGADGAAMRPDQVLMARQLAYQQQDGAGLARAWRSQVRNHGNALSSRALADSGGLLSPALLAAAQQGQVVRPADQFAAHHDAWRFTVHGGGDKPQHLALLADEPDQPPGRRRRGRAALRLELELADGSAVVLQVTPTPQGLAIEICAPDARALTRLRWLQPELEAALLRAGLTVLRWRFSDTLPPGRSHATIANAEQAAQSLTPAVFRAVAELALLLPSQAAN